MRRASGPVLMLRAALSSDKQKSYGSHSLSGIMQRSNHKQSLTKHQIFEKRARTVINNNGAHNIFAGHVVRGERFRIGQWPSFLHKSCDECYRIK